MKEFVFSNWLASMKHESNGCSLFVEPSAVKGIRQGRGKGGINSSRNIHKNLQLAPQEAISLECVWTATGRKRLMFLDFFAYF